MSFDDIAIRVSDVSKCYQIYDNPRDRLKQFVVPRMQRLAGRAPKQYFHEFWALKDVSFEVKKGETIGIVGRNGAGKSTLLQIITGVQTPTSGTVAAYGRVTALLELGAGLNPEFNGFDNIRMSAAVLGLSKCDLEEKIGEIVEFATLGDFIQQPIKLYSSGMVTRLAFATAVSFDPDILIVDEALAVGDELFQHKCIRRIQKIKENGASILFVSHSTHTINQICDRAVLLDGGRMLEIGRAADVSARYTKLLFSLEDSMLGSPGDSKNRSDEYVKPCMASEERFRPQEATLGARPLGRIIEVGVCGRDYRNLSFGIGETIRFTMRVQFHLDTQDVIMGLMITTPTGVDCYHTNILCRDQLFSLCKAGEIYTINFDIPLHLCTGPYVVVFDCQYDINATPKLIDIFYEALNFNITPRRLIDDGGVAALNADINWSVTNTMSKGT